MAKYEYGIGDASFQAAGGEQGISQLVNDFYDLMDTLPEAAAIRKLHQADLSMARQKLATFLCGWLGGPRRYKEKFGDINIPGFHRRFPIGSAERDAWLMCMRKAAEKQDYADDFRQYLLAQLAIPADRSRSLP